jgi:hypothetical protein
MPTLQEMYDTARQMPPAERLHLAAMLRDDFIQKLPSTEMDGDNNAWTEEDMRDIANHSLQYAAKLYDDEENLLLA